MKKQFENMLNNVLDSLVNEGIQGARSLDKIVFELENESKFTKEIQIVRNNQFELVFDTRENEVILKTTYSGQIINEEFLKELRILDNAKNTVETILSTIVALEGVEQ